MWLSGHLVIWSLALTLRTRIGSGRANRSREDRAKFDGFLDHDTKSRNELSARPSVAGSAIVGSDRRSTLCQLPSNRFGSNRPRELVNELQRIDRKQHRAFLQRFALLAHVELSRQTPFQRLRNDQITSCPNDQIQMSRLLVYR